MNPNTSSDVLFIFETYRRIRNEVIRESGNPDNNYLLEREAKPPLIEGPNRFYGKTTTGYVLEYYYGSPNKVHTPEGEYHYFRGNSCVPPQALLEKIDARLIEELGLVLGREQRYTTGPCGGEVGPYYKVVGTANFVVPEVSSLMLDGKALDSNDKMNLLFGALQLLIQDQPEQSAPDDQVSTAQPSLRGERLTKQRS